MILSVVTEYEFDGMTIRLTEYPTTGTFELAGITGGREIGVHGTYTPPPVQPTIPTLEGK